MEGTETVEVIVFTLEQVLIYGIGILFPPLLGWNIWLHKMVINNAKDIAVNTANDLTFRDMVSEIKTLIANLSDKVDQVLLNNHK